MSKPTDPAPSQRAEPSTAEVAEEFDGHGSVRETLESIIIAFVLAFIFRAFVVEAFVIPTGSMAPTLLGQHMHLDCPECGYRFTIGPQHNPPPAEQGPVRVPCPMCRFPIYEQVLPTDAGDRILVLKYVYTFNEPTRWDVVVFKNPTDPSENYIKRLVGLPGEQLLISGGDIYTRDLDAADDDAWQIQSKPDFVQRTVWQPVYRSNYYPLDGGDPTGSDRTNAWRMPWRMVGADGAWSHAAKGPRFVYDAGKGDGGELVFDFGSTDPGDRHRRIQPDVNYYPYNIIAQSANAGHGEDPIRDMRVAATVSPDSDGLRVTLTASDFEHVYRALVEPGQTLLQRADRPADASVDLDTLTWATLGKADAVALEPGQGTRLELWLVDGELSLLVDDERVALRDIPGVGTADRVRIERIPGHTPNPGRQTEPIVRVGVSGASATLRAVDLDRDLYYTNKRGVTGVSPNRPAIIREGHYYCLGDNSPQSQDGRLWNTVDDWVLKLADEPLDQLRGYVPADLMIGRAFFVYFPAGYRVTEGSYGALPNFGKMRFIH